MRTPEEAAAPFLTAFGWALTAASVAGGTVLAAAGSIDTGLITGGAAGLLAFLFRSWYKENKRKDESVWEIADEYRVDRDYERARAEHWQARWANLVRGLPELDHVPPIPNLDHMKAEAQREKEASRGRRK